MIKEVYMMENILITKLMDMENLFILMEIFIPGIGMKGKLMERVFIPIKMDLSWKENGSTIKYMDLVKRFGLITHNTKVNSLKEKSMEKEYLYGVMEPNMKVNS